MKISSVAQTLVDLGRRRSLASSPASLDHALRNGLVSKEEVEELAALRPGARGNPALMHVLEDVTGMRVVRWTWRDAYKVGRMLNALAEAGIRSRH